MVELRHRAVAALQRPHQMAHGIEADAVALGHAPQPRRAVGPPVIEGLVGCDAVGRVHEPAPDAAQGGQDRHGTGDPLPRGRSLRWRRPSP
jgi:hypothetical protein